MNSGDTISWAEAFPDRHPGHVLAGARYRENMTQKALSALVGCRPSHISEMEHGRRPIGKEMAKRLAAALGASYKVFLSCRVHEKRIWRSCTRRGHTADTC